MKAPDRWLRRVLPPLVRDVGSRAIMAALIVACPPPQAQLDSSSGSQKPQETPSATTSVTNARAEILRNPAVGQRDWPIYGGSPENDHYSDLAQINRGNVKQLTVAWSFDTQEEGGLQTSPLEVEGVLYALTPSQKVFAIDATTGKLFWKFDSGVKGTQPDRGLAYWTDGKDKRLLVGVMNYLYALDAATGGPIPTFGKNGRIDLREDLGRDPTKQSIYLTSPGVVYKDLIIVGGREPETLPAPPGDISRLRCAKRKTAVVVSHDSPSRGIRIRDLAEGGVEIERGGQQLGRHVGRRDAWDRLRSYWIGGDGFLWGRSCWR